MDTEIRNRKQGSAESASTPNGISSANKILASAATNSTTAQPDSPSSRSSEDVSGHPLTDSQKKSLAQEQEQAAFGKTPNGTSTFSTLTHLTLTYLALPCPALPCIDPEKRT